MSFKYILIFSCCFLLISCGDAQKKNKNTIVVKKDVTSIYTDLERNSVQIADYKGKKVLLNFWATWCTPCLKEMPSLANAQEILKDENYIFLFPTTDNLKRIKQFQKNNNYPFQFLQYNSTLDKLKIYALPATLIYDTKGNEVMRIDGATEWDSEEILNQLRAIQ
ncbi:MAG: TlpA family protein disulfide reductase [Flavobacteriaceae bacterium]|nr:TlpA family protein disulfide reductase [Flavobacteriaceae bacterium]